MIAFDHVLPRRITGIDPDPLRGSLLIVQAQVPGHHVVTVLLEMDTGVLARFGLGVVAAGVALDHVAHAPDRFDAVVPVLENAVGAHHG